MELMPDAPLFQPPSSFDRRALAAALTRLAAENILIGTSSWKYEGWLGQIYTRERYVRRAGFSKKYFEDTCLAEYAEAFPIVCGDFSFYQFPSEAYWQRLFGAAPASLRYAGATPGSLQGPARSYRPRAGTGWLLPDPSYCSCSQIPRPGGILTTAPQATPRIAHLAGRGGRSLSAVNRNPPHLLYCRSGPPSSGRAHKRGVDCFAATVHATVGLGSRSESGVPALLEHLQVAPDYKVRS